ncbi:hypothetical protein [Leptolyngbya sp. 7M]|uniref:hypothetical protein n=1 Tax=Leptolyngbya sp. 7M TaxID=2812896 RepID=UPI001B8BE75E|nr:hypothetical protein [Leptolyngbya sp. 7M]QYO64081.1 hypothetical protein JVX88_30660 [Leptolyngbya sp. 7M]
MPPPADSQVPILKPSPTADFALSLSRPTLLLLAFGSGVGMGLAPAPGNAWFLAWVALAPLWILVCRSATPLLAALVWGIGYHGLALSWIRDLHPLTWMGVPWLAQGSLQIALL